MPGLPAPDRSRPAWKRQFPVFGAVAGTVGSMAATEALKILANFGEPLFGRMAVCNLRDMRFNTFKIARNPDCAVCGNI